jgi:hypothetical protein
MPVQLGPVTAWIAAALLLAATATSTKTGSAASSVSAAGAASAAQPAAAVNMSASREVITLAGGCFWCIEVRAPRACVRVCNERRCRPLSQARVCHNDDNERRPAHPPSAAAGVLQQPARRRVRRVGLPERPRGEPQLQGRVRRRHGPRRGGAGGVRPGRAAAGEGVQGVLHGARPHHAQLSGAWCGGAVETGRAPLVQRRAHRDRLASAAPARPPARSPLVRRRATTTARSTAAASTTTPTRSATRRRRTSGRSSPSTRRPS